MFILRPFGLSTMSTSLSMHAMPCSCSFGRRMLLGSSGCIVGSGSPGACHLSKLFAHFFSDSDFHVWAH